MGVNSVRNHIKNNFQHFYLVELNSNNKVWKDNFQHFYLVELNTNNKVWKGLWAVIIRERFGVRKIKLSYIKKMYILN